MGRYTITNIIAFNMRDTSRYVYIPIHLPHLKSSRHDESSILEAEPFFKRRKIDQIQFITKPEGASSIAGAAVGIERDLLSVGAVRVVREVEVPVVAVVEVPKKELKVSAEIPIQLIETGRIDKARKRETVAAMEVISSPLKVKDPVKDGRFISKQANIDPISSLKLILLDPPSAYSNFREAGVLDVEASGVSIVTLESDPLEKESVPDVTGERDRTTAVKSEDLDPLALSSMTKDVDAVQGAAKLEESSNNLVDEYECITLHYPGSAFIEK